MRTVLKHIVAHTYKPVLQKYLSSPRSYRWKDITLTIPPEVFHPGFFSSTHFLLRYLDKFSLQGKRILELGAGSGLISIYAAKKNAIVTASDINPIAISNLERNCSVNNVLVNIIQSDLFENFQMQHFDLIVINPPYYKKDPVSFYEHAWYCGAKGEYFSKLFAQMCSYTDAGTKIFMVLCDDCDIPMIEKKAENHQAEMTLVESKQFLLEKNFIYQITYH